MDILADAIVKLMEVDKTMRIVTRQRNERVAALQNMGPINKFGLKIKSIFIPFQPVELSLTEEEQRVLNDSFEKSSRTRWYRCIRFFWSI